MSSTASSSTVERRGSPSDSLHGPLLRNGLPTTRPALPGPATEPVDVDVVHHYHHEEHEMDENDYLDDEGTADYPDIKTELGDC